MDNGGGTACLQDSRNSFQVVAVTDGISDELC